MMANSPISGNRDFRLMVIGQIISILGSALLRFALSLYVLDITGRADIYAALYAFSNIPLLISPVGGAVADRFNRRNLMVLFDFTSGIIISLYYVSLRLGGTSIFLTGAVLILLSVISSMYGPAVTASIPLLVKEEHLEGANGLVNGVQALSNVAACSTAYSGSKPWCASAEPHLSVPLYWSCSSIFLSANANSPCPSFPPWRPT